MGIIFFANGKFRLRFGASRIAGALVATSLLMGTLTFKMASWIGLSIPFDHLEFGNPAHHVMIALLLVVGSIIEELLYRQALWFSLEAMTDRWPRVVAWAPLVVTALLFSIGHLEAYSTVPPEYKSFVLFQTGYTLALGLWWGRIYQEGRSVGLTILLHMGYNFGFLLGRVV
ncbi:MAG: CPBP family intramembrane metalloprotease [Bdellovibrionales bacterium]|nr:CPBP family intramembrane metalloprotease [Bdellovibrionales bacterium]